MSIAGISSRLFEYGSHSIQNNFQQFQKGLQQLGQDLQSGNMTAAQQDFTTLQQLGPQASSTSGIQTNNPVAQDFSQLSQDLQAGNISAAQQDFSKVQQDFQSQASQGHHHHHHHHGGENGSNEISQLMSQLGQDLQSGNLSNAQQAYATLQQDLQQFGLPTATSSVQPSSQVTSSPVSLSA